MQMELRRYLEILSAYRWHLCVIPIVAALIGFAASFATSPRFVATATVQIIPAEIEPRTLTLRSQDGPPALALGLQDPTELLSREIVEGLASREVTERIAAGLNLGTPPAPAGLQALKAWLSGAVADAWAWLNHGYVARLEGDGALLAAIRGAVQARLVQGSYYMKISATWGDPATAARIANASVDAFVAHRQGVAAAAAIERRQFLEARVQEARQRVDQARAAVLAHGSGSDIVTADSLRAAVAALEEARASGRQNESALADARRREATAAQQLQAIPLEARTIQEAESTARPRPTAEVVTTGPNPVYQALQERRLGLRQEVVALEARRGVGDSGQQASTDSALTEARQRLAEVERQLAATDPRERSVQTVVTQGDDSSTTTRTTTPNPVYLALHERLLGLRQDVAALEARQGHLQAQVGAREAELRALAGRDSRLAALSQDLTLAGDAYSRRAGEWYDALIEESRPVNLIRMIDPARAPLYPSGPLRVLWLAVGALAGLAATAALIFIRSATDLSVHTAAEVEAALDLRLLSIVPVARATWPTRLLGSRREDR
jgi:polysaccharide biosynthesis transport protein